MKALILAAATAASAAAIPDYDVKALCAHRASMTGSLSQSVLRACYHDQQSAYDALKPIWAKAPEDIRASADATARSKNASGGLGDYEVLESFVMRGLEERDAKGENDQFRLKR